MHPEVGFPVSEAGMDRDESSDNFIQLVFEDALRARFDKARNQIAYLGVVHHGFQCQPVPVVKVTDGGSVQAGQQANDTIQLSRWHIHF